MFSYERGTTVQLIIWIPPTDLTRDTPKVDTPPKVNIPYKVNIPATPKVNIPPVYYNVLDSSEVATPAKVVVPVPRDTTHHERTADALS